MRIICAPSFILMERKRKDFSYEFFIEFSVYFRVMCSADYKGFNVVTHFFLFISFITNFSKTNSL